MEAIKTYNTKHLTQMGLNQLKIEDLILMAHTLAEAVLIEVGWAGLVLLVGTFNLLFCFVSSCSCCTTGSSTCGTETGPTGDDECLNRRHTQSVDGRR